MADDTNTPLADAIRHDPGCPAAAGDGPCDCPWGQLKSAVAAYETEQSERPAGRPQRYGSEGAGDAPPVVFVGRFDRDEWDAATSFAVLGHDRAHASHTLRGPWPTFDGAAAYATSAAADLDVQVPDHQVEFTVVPMAPPVDVDGADG